MRRLPLLLLPLLLVIAASCSSDSTETTATTATTTTSTTVEVTGSTGLCDLPGDVLTCEVETSDDRVSGIAEIDVSCELTENGETTIGDCSGPATYTNEGGTWEGTCEGTTTWSTSEPAHVHIFDCTYRGTGEYAGLLYREHFEGTDYPWTITGMIEPVQ
jgi:hypothetical protein